MKFGVWTQCRDQPCSIELRFSILRLLEQYATENNHLLCYWSIIHNLISKICPVHASQWCVRACVHVRVCACLTVCVILIVTYAACHITLFWRCVTLYSARVKHATFSCTSMLPSCNIKSYLSQLKTYVRCYMSYAVNIRVYAIRVPIVMNAASH